MSRSRAESFLREWSARIAGLVMLSGVLAGCAMSTPMNLSPEYYAKMLAHYQTFSCEDLSANIMNNDSLISKEKDPGFAFNLRRQISAMNEVRAQKGCLNAEDKNVAKPSVLTSNAPDLGIRLAAPTASQVRAMGATSAKGVVVAEVEKNTPAEKAGVLTKDVVLAINDQSVTTPEKARAALDKIDAGDKEAKLLIWRKGKRRVIHVALADAPPAKPGAGGVTNSFDTGRNMPANTAARPTGDLATAMPAGGIPIPPAANRINPLSQPLPQLDDPQLQSFLDILMVQYDQYLKSGSPHLKRPAEAKSWPCKLTQAQLNKLAGTVNSDDDPVRKRQLINEARSNHTPPSKEVFANQVFYPVTANCVNGKLEGPVDFWIEYDSTAISPALSIAVHKLAHFQFTAKKGEPTGLVSTTIELLSMDTTFNDAATAALMAQQKKHNSLSLGFAVKWVAVPPVFPEPGVTFSHVDLDSNGAVRLSMTATRVFDGNRYEVMGFGTFGPLAHKDYTKPYKDGKLHGLLKSYSGMMGNFPVPAREECWQDGEKILTTTCSVD